MLLYIVAPERNFRLKFSPICLRLSPLALGHCGAKLVERKFGQQIFLLFFRSLDCVHANFIRSFHMQLSSNLRASERENFLAALSTLAALPPVSLVNSAPSCQPAGLIFARLPLMDADHHHHHRAQIETLWASI